MLTGRRREIAGAARGGEMITRDAHRILSVQVTESYTFIHTHTHTKDDRRAVVFLLPDPTHVI